MITNQSIIDSIEKHCLATGMASSTFGRKAVNDGKLIARLKDGKPISIDTYNRIMAFIDAAETAEAAQ
ncbi:hypothetical protein EV286_107491 [Rhizobium sp. BK251]|nr:hypothetical protein EV286_107491 [Rhizobium sp. BK251]